ncbi:MAG: hypothetical protein PHG25_00215 [Candidatus Pacebacteria bacterium]|nr:hypothetical protein [Candidatus Paceibacterota bacterium]
MEITLDEVIDPRMEPIYVVENMLNHIKNMSEKLNIPFKGFAAAAARMKRKSGITFLVTLEEGGKEEFVPLRVESTKMAIYTQFADRDSLASWRGKQIHSIKIYHGQTMGELFRKITTYLKTSLHRFKRKLQGHAHRNGLKLEKRLLRTQQRSERYRRPDHHQCNHH